MSNVYLISLIVGGFFVLLSIFGAGDHDSDVDVDVDADVDLDIDADGDLHIDAGGHDLDPGVGIVDLLSIRALFLFAAFFGLTGVLLNLTGTAEPMTSILSVATGVIAGLGGNYIIKKFAYEQVSSNTTTAELKGRTAQVILPFTGAEKGKIAVLSKGRRLQLTARPLDDETAEAFRKGDDVVIVRMNGPVAEVVKPT
jgi:membrane protein implicated in regulation of membrane protease activity